MRCIDKACAKYVSICDFFIVSYNMDLRISADIYATANCRNYHVLRLLLNQLHSGLRDAVITNFGINGIIWNSGTRYHFLGNIQRAPQYPQRNVASPVMADFYWVVPRVLAEF